MSPKSERDLSPANCDLITQAKLSVQAENVDYAISLYETVLKDEPLYRPTDNKFLFAIATGYLKKK